MGDVALEVDTRGKTADEFCADPPPSFHVRNTTVLKFGIVAPTQEELHQNPGHSGKRFLRFEKDGFEKDGWSGERTMFRSVLTWISPSTKKLSDAMEKMHSAAPVLSLAKGDADIEAAVREREAGERLIRG
jgi:hypothetical protein